MVHETFAMELATSQDGISSNSSGRLRFDKVDKPGFIPDTRVVWLPICN